MTAPDRELVGRPTLPYGSSLLASTAKGPKGGRGGSGARGMFLVCQEFFRPSAAANEKDMGGWVLA